MTKVRIFRHEGAGEDDPLKWQADIWAEGGYDNGGGYFHALASSPSEALLRAAQRWHEWVNGGAEVQASTPGT